MSSPVEKFDELARSAAFVFLVYYRGHWCPFCVSYLKSLESLRPAISSAGGAVVAVTAETELANLSQMRSSSGYQGTVLTDPQNTLAQELKRRGLLDVAITEKKGYDHGLAQPAVLVQKGGEAMYSWAIVPSMMNFGGAKGRPQLDQLWGNISAQLNGKPKVNEKIGVTTAMGVLSEKIFG